MYCGAANVVSTKITGRKGKLNIKGISGETSTSESSPQLKIDCPMCDKKYVCIMAVYPEYLKNHVKLTDDALLDLKRIFPRLKKLENIYKNSTGIANLRKKVQKIRSKDYDITFKLSSKRAYLHCKKKGDGLFKKRKTLFIAVSVIEV